MTSRTPTRVQLGAAAVLSVAEAAQMLPWADTQARLWLEARDLILDVPGAPGPCVVWGKVVEALTGPQEEVVQVRLKRSGVL